MQVPWSSALSRWHWATQPGWPGQPAGNMEITSSWWAFERSTVLEPRSAGDRRPLTPGSGTVPHWQATGTGGAPSQATMRLSCGFKMRLGLRCFAALKGSDGRGLSLAALRACGCVISRSDFNILCCGCTETRM